MAEQRPKKLNSCHSLERKMYINLNENISFVIICNAIHYPCHSKYDECAAVKRTRAPPTHPAQMSGPPDVTFTANQSNGELAFVVNPHKLPRKRAGKSCLSKLEHRQLSSANGEAQDVKVGVTKKFQLMQQNYHQKFQSV